MGFDTIEINLVFLLFRSGGWVGGWVGLLLPLPSSCSPFISVPHHTTPVFLYPLLCKLQSPDYCGCKYASIKRRFVLVCQGCTLRSIDQISKQLRVNISSQLFTPQMSGYNWGVLLKLSVLPHFSKKNYKIYFWNESQSSRGPYMRTL